MTDDKRNGKNLSTLNPYATSATGVEMSIYWSCNENEIFNLCGINEVESIEIPRLILIFA